MPDFLNWGKVFSVSGGISWATGEGGAWGTFGKAEASV
jgi:hypothetical protein